MIQPVNNFRLAVLICVLLIVPSCFLIAGCRRNSGGKLEQPAKSGTTPVRDINDVLRDHDDELMAIPGVVGVYVGLMPDERTPCLKVMAARKTPELDQKVPKSIEGYPVVVEESGIIRPMDRKK
jgi:hypothetical protein